MQSVETRLSVLLMRWSEQQRLGCPVSPEELCRDCPDLLPEFKRQLEALEAIRSVLERDTRTAADHLPGTQLETSTWGLMTAVEGYDVLGELGHGGMGVVYRAFDRVRNRVVALKTLHRANPSTLYLFKQEFRALADVTHSNLVSLYELVSDGHDWFISMEFVDGVDFLSYVRASVNSLDAAATDPAPGALPPVSRNLPRTDAIEYPGSTNLSGSLGQSATEPELEAWQSIARNLPPTDAIKSSSLEHPSGSLDESATEPGPEAWQTTARTLPPTDAIKSPSLEHPTDSLSKSATEPGLEVVQPGRGDLPRTEAIPSHGSANSTSVGAGHGDQKRTGEGLSARQLVRLRLSLIQLAQGLIALHDAGLLHRDIKPSNILVTGRGRVVLLDFGLAVEMEATGLHENSEPHVLGTVAYMSPEQAAGLPVSAAADWYSVGVVLYKALTARLPFDGRPLRVLIDKQQFEPPAPRELAADTPEDLNALCVDLLRRDPHARPKGRDVLLRLGVSPDAQGGPNAAQSSARRSLKLVGRERHLAALNDAFATVVGGSAVALYMHGRSGAGKSALLEHFLERLIQGDEAVVLAGRCYERESVPYKALDSLIDALSRYLKRLPNSEVEALLPRDLPSLVRVFPVLRRADAVAAAPRRPNNALDPDPQELRRRAFSALRELLARLGDRRSLVLAIDDLQWGDRDSAALLAEILGPPDPPVLLLVGCYRSEDADTSPFLEHLLKSRGDRGPSVDEREIAVEALTPSESETLAAMLLDETDPTAGANAAAIARESGGSPFFVIELVRHVQIEGETANQPTLGEDLTLDRVLMARISRLPEEARRLLEVIAVSGRPLSKADACQAAGVEADDLEALAILRSARLIRGTGPAELDVIESYHDRIRETVVAYLDSATRVQHHGRLAHVLKTSARTDPEVLAFHFQAAGEPETAGEYYATAAAGAAGTLAFDRASKLYQVALELVPADHSDRSRLRINLADALANAGRGYEAARQYLAAAEVAPASDALDLRRNAAMQLLISGHIDEGLGVFDAVLRAVGMSLPTTLGSIVSMLYHRAFVRVRGASFRRRESADLRIDDIRRADVCWTAAAGLGLVDYIRGADFSARHLLLSLRAGEPRRVAKALAWEAASSSCGGPAHRPHSERLFAEAEGLAGQLNDPYTNAMIAMTRGAAHYLAGRWKISNEFLNQAEGLFSNIGTGVVWEVDTTRTFILWSLLNMGLVNELTQRHASLFRDAQERGDLYALMNLGTHIMSIVRAGEDRPEAARHALHEITARWSQRGYHVQHHNFLLATLTLDLYEGRGQAAWNFILEKWGFYRLSYLMQVQQVRLDLLQLRARAALAAAQHVANPEPFLLNAERQARKIEKEPAPSSMAHVDYIRAAIAAARGDDTRAVTLLEKSTEAFQANDMFSYVAAMRRRRGELLGGDTGQALVREANTWMTRQGIQNPTRMTAMYAPGFPD